MTGENGKRDKSVYGSKSNLNMTLPLHLCGYLGWVICLMVIIPMVYHTIHHFGFGSMLPIHSVLLTCSREIPPSVDIYYNIVSLTSFLPLLNELCIITFCLKSWHLFHVVNGGYIKAVLHEVASCRHQHIIQEVDLETPLSVLWSLHASMASFSLSTIGWHQWPSTKIFCVVFDIGSYIHTTWIVL